MKKEKTIKGIAVYGKIKYEIAIVNGLEYRAKINHTKIDQLAMLHFAKTYCQMLLDTDAKITDKKKKMSMHDRGVIANGSAAMQIMIGSIYPKVYEQLNKPFKEKVNDAVESRWTKFKSRIKGLFLLR